MTGWFTEDFTLAELKTLRASERLPGFGPATPASTASSRSRPSRRSFATSRERERHVGVYPETKHPTYFARSASRSSRARRRPAPQRPRHAGANVFVQSFEVENLQMLRAELNVPLVQLLGPRGDGSPGAAADRRLRRRGRPEQGHIVPRDAADASLPATRFVATRTPPGCSCTPTRSGARTASCPRSCAAEMIRPRPGTSRRSCGSSSRWGSTAFRGLPGRRCWGTLGGVGNEGICD